MKNNYTVALFYTNSSAIRAEKLTKKAGIECKLIPTPRELSSDCGIALRFDVTRSETVKEIFDSNSVEYASINPLE